jgi:hypothetical protein
MNPKAEIGNVEDAPTPIVSADALRRTIRTFDRKAEDEFPQDIRDKINGLLGGTTE